MKTILRSANASSYYWRNLSMHVLKLLLMLMAVNLYAIEPKTNDPDVAVDGGTISGGPFMFCVDGEADHVSGITLTGESGSLSQWIVTDETGKILGLPPTPEAVNFDEAGPGICLIWHLSFEDDCIGLEVGNNALTDLFGTFDLSNEIRVYRNQPDAGLLSGGPFTFTVDGTPDFVSGISLSGDRSGANATFVITDDKGNILGLPPTIEAVEGVDFDAAGAGVCLIWYLRYEDGLTGLAAGENTHDFNGCYDLSNPISVTRNLPPVVGGTLSGGPFMFCAGDGEADNVSGVAVSGNSGQNSQYVVTDEQGNILGLPPTPEAVDFDGAGPGVCLIWNLSYNGDITGLEAGQNANDLQGDFELSNSVRVYRNDPEAGTLTGGPYTFIVDGTPDFASGLNIEGERRGDGFRYIITDNELNILGLPPTLEAARGVDFDAAGEGVCLIWYIRYYGEISGLEAGANAADIEGCFDLSNSITVTRNLPPVVGGTLSGGPFMFCAGDGEADNVSGVAVSGNSGQNSQYVVTDEQGNILGLPPTPEAVDFDGAGPGVCLIWHLSYNGDITGLEAGQNANDLQGDFELSNSVRVYRNDPEAGTLTGGPYTFIVDGTPDFASGLNIEGERRGDGFRYIITDNELNILGLPPTLEAARGVDFDAAGEGVCLIWYIRYYGEISGLEAGANAADIEGCFDLSNSITVTRNLPPVVGGTLSGGPFMFCAGDGEVDNVSGVAVSGNSGQNSQYVVTDEQGNILGLPPTPEAVDFDGAGPGVCLIWHLSYNGDIIGLEAGQNANDLQGDFELSNSVRVYRNDPEAGTLTGGPYWFMVGDGIADMAAGLDITGERRGDGFSYIVTDADNNILGLPPTLEAARGVDFDGAGGGNCLIWYVRYYGEISGLEVGQNANDLDGCFDLSNAVLIERTPVLAKGGTLTGGPFRFCVGDGQADNVSGITLEGNMGENSQYIVTDEQGNILGLPPTPEAVNFDDAGPGVCLIWHLSYNGDITGLEAGQNANDLQGDLSLSNAIRVYREQPEAGTLTGGPYWFTVGDGIADMATGLDITGERRGDGFSYIVTDADNNILGLPPTLEAARGVDFDGAGGGNCLIWYVRYYGEISGLEVGQNANDLDGCFDLSNSILIERTPAVAEGGTLTGGPYTFCVGDGQADNVSGVTLAGNTGVNSQWIVTDEQGNILGLPPTPEAVNFDVAGPGICLIWHLSYNGDITGLEAGQNANDLQGDFDLSNSVRVYRNEPLAGTLTGGPYTFTVDGTADFASGLDITGERRGDNFSYIITDLDGKILGLPPTLDDARGVNFDAAGPGTCLIWYIRYYGEISGLEVDANANDLQGCFDLSNAITVERVEPSGRMTAKMFPIPASTTLNVKFDRQIPSTASVRLYDITGNVVMSKEVQKGNSTDLDVRNIPAGIYIITIDEPKSGMAIKKKVVIN
ncbi:T9SS type A sorting domain-containing protein [Spongiivirga sp. MCCC 1A20706]|uniref:T9SS type A sorting domain-containing protein n=1 Tax=Spongiivirga sp. MCCC 1A20706 TaxID=3160963 RepID=UPI0039777A59